MNGGGITDRILRFSNSVVGHFRGGLAQTNIVGSMIFAGISGTAAADAASQGAVLIPGMARVGYTVPYAAAVTAASAVVGPIIPPSVPMIIVGSLTGISVGQMFLAGAVPGLLLGLGMMVPAYILAVRDNHPREPWRGWREVWASGRDALWAMGMMFLVLFGIVGGFFTPTEAAVIAVLYASAVGLFVYKELGWRDLPRLLADSAISGAAIMLLVGFANVFGWILAAERVPQMLTEWMASISTERWALMLMINILLLVVGMFMETIAALIILFPPLLAIATAAGIDPVHFATFAVLNLMIGLATPPVGVCLFICASIGRISLWEITVAVWPFLLSNFVVLGLVTAIPAISLWLPSLFYR
jgi:C4-dicarboxylate transporter, DctM subunit